MIILLTGKPGVGKSTAIEAFLSLNPLPVSWVLTRAIVDPETGMRQGFEAVDSEGRQRVISHKTDLKSDTMIGQNRVDIEAVDSMFADAFNRTTGADDLLVIDEIGPIQLLSRTFRATLADAFRGNRTIVATIHYDDERLAGYREDPHHVLLEVTEQNREIVPEVLVAIIAHLSAMQRLSEAQQRAVNRLLAQYIRHNAMRQLKKLVANAVYYVADGQVERLDDTCWRVEGRHGEYSVTRQGDIFACTCDLFYGKGKYVDQAGECSHIQAAMIGEQ